MRITEEIDAGACGLDGEELTQALLHENRGLIAENKALSSQVWEMRDKYFRNVLIMYAVALFSLSINLFR